MSSPDPDDIEALLEDLNDGPDAVGGAGKGEGEGAFLDRIEALIRDPLKLIEHNNAHRRAGEDASDLLTLDQVKKLQARGPYDHAYPTVTTHQDGVTVPALTQKEYNALYSERRILANAVMIQLSTVFKESGDGCRVVTAGGGPMAPYLPTDRLTAIGDDDFFLVNCGDDESKMWKSALMWLRAVAAALFDEHVQGLLGFEGMAPNPTVIIAPGLITVRGNLLCHVGNDYTRRAYKLQLILQKHGGCSIYGFDIPSCCIEYDGDVTRVTPFGAYALVTGSNLVVPEYGSASYNHRLAKKSFLFNLTMPHLDPLRLSPQAAVRVGGLEITALGQSDGGVQFASVVAEGASRAQAATSGYERADESPYDTYDVSYAGPAINTKILVKGEDPMRLHMFYTMGNPMDVSRDFSWMATGTPPLPTEIFPVGDLNVALNVAERHWVLGPETGDVHEANLAKYFGLTPAQVTKFSAAVRAAGVRLRLRGRNPGQIDLSAALAPFRAAITQRYNANIAVKNEPLRWWYSVADKDGAYTSAFNPRPATPKEWYGDAYAEPVPRAAPAQRTPAAVADPNAVTCCICLCPVSGRSSVIRLACGHVMHLTNPPDCRGLLGWAAAGKNTCPQCRAVFDAAPAAGDKVVLTVDWDGDR